MEVAIEKARQELAMLRARGALDRQNHELEKDKLHKRFKDAETRVETLLTKTISKSPLFVYTQCIKIARANDSTTPHYATYLESQVCRSVHQVVMIKKQLAMIKLSCDAMVNLMQRAIGSLKDEQTQMEMSCMNGMYAMTGSKASMELKYAMELQELNMEKKKLMSRGGGGASTTEMIPRVGSTENHIKMSDAAALENYPTATSPVVTKHHHHKSAAAWKPPSMSRATSSLRTHNYMNHGVRSAIRN